MQVSTQACDGCLRKQRVALTRVNVRALPSLRCVAPAGSAEGEHGAPSGPEEAPTQGLVLIPPFNTTLPNHASNSNKRHSKRKHTRLSLVAAAACAAGALTATAVAEGITPWVGTSGAVAASTHVASSVSARQAGTGAVQLDARIIPTPGGATGSNAVAPAQALTPASDWARALALTPVKHVPAVQAPAAHAAPPRTPAVHAAPATATVKVKGAQAPAAQPKAAPAHATPAKAAPAKAAPAKAAPAKAAPARKARAKAAPVHVARAKRYLIYDSVTPRAIPAGQRVATYSNGMYKASSSAVHGRGHVLWIDTNGSDPGANVLDVEPGDATPVGAAQWVKARLNAHKDQLAVVYTYLSAWQAVKANVAALPSWMQAKVRYWIADPTGVNHVVPGSNATQWYWGKYYDITTANPGFEAP